MTAIAIAWSGAVAIGISLGLFGSGGSILTVPVLVYLFGQDEKIAIAGSLAIVGSIALAGAIPYLRERLVDWRNVWLFGLPGMAGTYLGAILATWMTGVQQLALFALVMLTAAAMMLRPPRLDATPHIARVPWKIVVDGLIVGVVTGLVGVGGGFLIVPALVLLGGLPMHIAVGTSLAVIALNSLAGFIRYQHVLSQLELSPNWLLVATVSLVGFVGSLLGGAVASHIPREKLQKFFAAFLVAMGVFILSRYLPGVI